MENALFVCFCFTGSCEVEEFYDPKDSALGLIKEAVEKRGKTLLPRLLQYLHSILVAYQQNPHQAGADFRVRFWARGYCPLGRSRSSCGLFGSGFGVRHTDIGTDHRNPVLYLLLYIHVLI